MKSGYFSQESLSSFQGQVLSEGGSTSLTESPKDGFFTSALNTSAGVGCMVADNIGAIRGEYIDSYDYTRCQRPNGTFYGTGGRCRSGVDAGAKPESSVKVEKYSWGELVKVSNDWRSGQAVLHPEHQELALKPKDGESGRFQDEQKKKYAVRREGDTILLKEVGRKEELNFSRDKLPGAKGGKKPEKSDKNEFLRDPSQDVRRGNTLIGTSPRNMAIDNLNGVRREFEAYKKKFGNREDLQDTIKVYEKRIADAEKSIREKYS